MPFDVHEPAETVLCLDRLALAVVRRESVTP
jgi:hypothetical protein